MLIEMELSRILIREIADSQFIELRELSGNRTFPIVVGRVEAYAIERRLKGLEPPRPQTHELLFSIIEKMGGVLSKIVIDDLADGTFFAKLFIHQGEQELMIDSRPSDAIALGIAVGAPILVDEQVLDEVEKDLTDFESPESFDLD